MAFDAVLARFVAASPVTVMARLVLQRALSAEWVDGVFERHRERQYTRELLFSTVVELMSLVAVGLRPSLHAAAQRAKRAGRLDVSLAALYEKVTHAEPAVLRALVRESAERLAPVVARLAAPPGAGAAEGAAALPGYRVRVVDGNHLPASERRVKPLRGLRAAPLPGQALVVYEPALGLATDLVPAEDAHASEQRLVPPLVARAGPGELWIADRNFSTRAILAGYAARGAAFIVRETETHPQPLVLGPRQYIGRTATGAVYEQAVAVPPPAGAPADTPPLAMRRIEVELDTPTEDGDTGLRLLTTLPASVALATTVAALYRRRWTIEGMFGRLEAVLASEIPTLAHPRAALLAFAVAVVAYNVLAVVQTAVEAEAAARARARAERAVPISMYYLAAEVREHYGGLVVAVDPAVWARYDRQGPAALARMLRGLAAHVALSAFRKHPRGPKQKKRNGYAPRAEVQRTVATKRLLDEQKNQSSP